jgi:hypothetical protein
MATHGETTGCHIFTFEIMVQKEPVLIRIENDVNLQGGSGATKIRTSTCSVVG